MNGGHDVGGMHGFGPIGIDPDEPVFHSEWERSAFALTLAVGSLGHWNLDQSRYAREQMAPGEYLTTSYYEHWLFGLELLMREHDILSTEDIEKRIDQLRQGHADNPADATASRYPGPANDRVLAPEAVAVTLGRGGSARMDDELPARFGVGDTVNTIDEHPRGHTRLPRYARRKTGRIAFDQGVFVFPDSHARGVRKAQRLYTVTFTAREIWGEHYARDGDDVLLDLFDSYLLATDA